MRYSTLRNFVVSVLLLIGLIVYQQGIYPVVDGQILSVRVVSPTPDQKEEKIIDTFPGTRDEYTLCVFVTGACFVFFAISLSKFLREGFRRRNLPDVPDRPGMHDGPWWY